MSLMPLQRKLTLPGEYMSALEKPRFVTADGIRKTTEVRSGCGAQKRVSGD
jgi:hypothetical protein